MLNEDVSPLVQNKWYFPVQKSDKMRILMAGTSPCVKICFITDSEWDQNGWTSLPGYHSWN